MPSQNLLASAPIQIGAVKLSNRYIMGSMHTGLESELDRFDELADYYAERARGGVSLMVTGGFSPNFAGRMKYEPSFLNSHEQVEAHKKITSAVHEAGGRILLQLLHAGRYGYHAEIVAPSAIKSPINRDEPRALSDEEIRQTIQDYARSAELAISAGYDGVEIMASEGYLISQFLAPTTNVREDEWGGSLENRARFPLEVVKAVKEAIGPGPILSYRISATDLLEDGDGLEDNEIIWLAKKVEENGANVLCTGIGWHESQVPTISAAVPHAAFTCYIQRLKESVSIPVAASNRINLPSVAEDLLAKGQADLVTMARPFLADPFFVQKALNGNGDRISVCIGCNQACLDHYFTDQVISCLVNPRVIKEAAIPGHKTTNPKKIAVIGGGVAGIAAALETAQRGHNVTIFEADDKLGGQFNLAAKVPGKSDYGLFLDACIRQLEDADVKVELGSRVTASDMFDQGFEDIILSSGIRPRELDIPGSDDPRVVGYTDILSGRKVAGDNVIIIGAGGIGHDVALFISHSRPDGLSELEAFEKHWGIGRAREPEENPRTVTMLKRSEGRFGTTLGKSTGWILRQELRDYNVQQIQGVTYLKIDQEGLHVEVDGKAEILPADTIIVCAGQVSEDSLITPLEEAGLSVHVIGGAKLAGELDAKRAIQEGLRVGSVL